MASRRSHSVELATLAKYPFLLEASAFIRSEKVSLEEILLEPAYARARTLGKARVLDALERGPESERVAIAIADQLAQLLAYPVARILASAIGDTYLVRRYALHEAIAAEKRLESESDDLILHLASELGMDLRRQDGGFRLHFTDFLRFTNTMRDAPWKLINRRVPPSHRPGQRGNLPGLRRRARLRGRCDEISDRAHHGDLEPDRVHPSRVLDDEVLRHLPRARSNLPDDQASPAILPRQGAGAAAAGRERLYGDLAEKPRHVETPRWTAVRFPRTAKSTRTHSSGWNATGAIPQTTFPAGETMS